MKLLVATRSPGKMREIRRILGGVDGLELLDLDEEGIDPAPEEDGLEPYATFEENALSKARYFAERAGLPTVADDSGIEVDALDGAPGVRTKRFAEDGGVDVSELNPDDGFTYHRIVRVRQYGLVAITDGVLDETEAISGTVSASTPGLVQLKEILVQVESGKVPGSARRAVTLRSLKAI